MLADVPGIGEIFIVDTKLLNTNWIPVFGQNVRNGQGQRSIFYSLKPQACPGLFNENTSVTAV